MRPCKTSTKPNHVYKIYNTKTGEVIKWGISGGKITKSGKSYRVQRQLALLQQTYPNMNLKTQIIAKNVSRQKALKIEQGKVNAYSKAAQKSRGAQPKTPPRKNTLPTPTM